ncbi:contact-dependent growth inhibition system immunity protein [Lelliottia sp. V89_10]|uniref:contact-dependent growth inhibition system immunity protein n=1 Tax=Lelliottia wanjuensis TaxID=3050585 RepID=UPI00249EB448|nr:MULTISPECIES: contact-dependent growth inhibition system immunity protein [unclassified Lelliottia]MDI3359364.1 contact-dependent growth inhibition system immunity protein [Lelliottia sp. V89_13]MDK9549954.1 contact-dependent growth inhibition system immunity protein [Lelliottia sp. V89_5]MDK9596382.1 contact-dependent growth inhibition system immunity protein [Lelliottia sp. V89_10]
MKFNKDQDYWVNVFVTNDFLLIETQSGLGMVATDPLFPAHLLPPSSSDEIIGQTILQALSDSRTLTDLADRIALFDLEKGKEQYAAWVAMLMSQYGYKTKRALFKNMKNCSIHCVNGIITISPSRHEKLEAWGRTKGDGIEDVVLSVDSTPEEIGAGLRLALSRCKG